MKKIYELTDRQLDLYFDMSELQYNFCVNVIAGMTQVRAYKEAGGTSENPVTVRTSAHGMRRGKKVKEFLDEHRKREAEKLKAIVNDQDKMKQIITEQLFHQATTDITDIAEFMGDEDISIDPLDETDPEDTMRTSQTYWRLLNSDELSPRARACIESVEITKQGLKLKQASKREAAKVLAKWGGWEAPERKEITGADGKPLNPTPEMSEDDLKEALEKLGFGANSQLGDREIE